MSQLILLHEDALRLDHPVFIGQMRGANYLYLGFRLFRQKSLRAEASGFYL